MIFKSSRVWIATLLVTLFTATAFAGNDCGNGNYGHDNGKAGSHCSHQPKGSGGGSPHGGGGNTATGGSGGDATGVGVGIGLGGAGGAGGNATSTSFAAGGTAVAVGGSAVASGGKQSQQQKQNISNVVAPVVAPTITTETGITANQQTANDAANSGTATITETYKAAKIPVATAWAAPLTSGQDTCLGSWSAGGQAEVVGLSVGSTKKDQNCIMIKQVHMLQEMHLQSAACFRAAQDEAIAKAFQAAHVDCSTLDAPTPAPAPTASAQSYVTPEQLSAAVDELKARQDRATERVLGK